MFDDAPTQSDVSDRDAVIATTSVEMPGRVRQGRRVAAAVCGLIAYALSAQLATNEVVVQPGDTLSKIAGDYRVSVRTLAAFNGIDDPNQIRSGQTIVIPPASGETTHQVRPGDTLSLLATIYNSSTTAIAERNQLTNANMIRIGQHLVIPRVGAASTSAPSPAPASTPSAAPTTTVAPPAPTTIAPALTAAPTTAPPANIVVPTTSAPAPTTAAPAPTAPAPTTPPGTIPKVTVPRGGLVSTMWVVQAGDTVASIADRFGIPARRLASANAIRETDPLLPGQRIYVPQS